MSNRLFHQAVRSIDAKAPSISSPSPSPSSSSTRCTAATPPSAAPSPAPSAERQIYIPPGKRGLIERQAQGTDTKAPLREEEKPRPRREREREREREKERLQAVEEQRRRAFFGDSPAPVRQERPAHTGQTPRRAAAAEKDVQHTVSDDRIASSCVVLCGLPSEMSEAGRESEISPFVEAGGVPKWLCANRDCVLVFLNEATARRALSLASKSSRFRPSPFKESAHCDAATIAVLRPIHAGIRPERDTRVANRLIGAALGLRIPRKETESKSVKAVKAEDNNHNIEREKEDVPDAWDD